MSRKVVVTGLGCITPLGNSVKESWTNLLNSVSGIIPLTSLPNYKQDYELFAHSIPTNLHVGAINTTKSQELSYMCQNLFTSQDSRRMTPLIKNSILSTHMALQSANLLKDWQIDETMNDLGKISVTMGVGLPPVAEISGQAIQFYNKGKRPTPMFIPQVLPNMVASSISIKYGIRGPTQAVSSACSTGNNSIIDGINMIENDLVDIAIVGASETSLHPLTLAGFHRLKSLSNHGVSRPFDSDRDGFIMGEGSGTIILEDYEHAMKRNATILATVENFGITSDAFHVTQPKEDSQGVLNAMDSCMERSNVRIHELDFVNAHATSTPVGDQAELNGIQKLLNLNDIDRETPLYVTSNKGAMGHLLGAAGLIESIFTILSLKERIIPHTLNLNNEIEPEATGDKVDPPHFPVHNNNIHLVRDKPINLPSVKYGLCNSFGFGGINTSILFSNK